MYHQLYVLNDMFNRHFDFLRVLQVVTIEGDKLFDFEVSSLIELSAFVVFNPIFNVIVA